MAPPFAARLPRNKHRRVCSPGTDCGGKFAGIDTSARRNLKHTSTTAIAPPANLVAVAENVKVTKFLSNVLSEITATTEKQSSQSA